MYLSANPTPYWAQLYLRAFGWLTVASVFGPDEQFLGTDGRSPPGINVLDWSLRVTPDQSSAVKMHLEKPSGIVAQISVSPKHVPKLPAFEHRANAFCHRASNTALQDQPNDRAPCFFV
jgi:hypothetical protein